MRVVRRFAELPAAARGAAVAIGNFDGVHLGHCAVLETARRLAHQHACPFGVVTFEPHPREILDPTGAPARLTPFRAKAERLRALGVALLVALPFDRALARLEPEDFVRDLLLGRLGVRAIATGTDFRFGRERRGDVSLLAELARRLGLAFEAVAPVVVDGERCSSSAIRAHLAAGRVERAAQLLGRPYELEGRVVAGDRRGRTLGFPTANLEPPRGQQLPADGVYAVRAHIRGELPGSSHPGVANLGYRPTFAGTRRLLEVHLLDGSFELYGRRLRVSFLAHLRGERRFADRSALIEQIARDCEAARRILCSASSETQGPPR